MSSIVIKRQYGKLSAQLRYIRVSQAGRHFKESVSLGILDSYNPACLLDAVLNHARKTRSIDRLFALRDATKDMPDARRKPGSPKRKRPQTLCISQKDRIVSR